MSNSIYIICGFFAIAIIAACIVAPYVAFAKKLRPLLFIALVISLWAGDKPDPPAPVIVVKDIEVKSFRCDHTGAAITWACGTNIVLGVDKFIILRSTRQIPARTGWGPYEEYSESMTTNWATATPQHASDTRWMVIVRKGAN